MSKWELAAESPYDPDETDRLPVPGGWLYRTRDTRGVALAFVPDPAADHVRAGPFDQASLDRLRGSRR